MCEVSITKSMREKTVNLEKDSPWLLEFLWYGRLYLVGLQVVMELVHMHEDLVRFPAIA